MPNPTRPASRWTDFALVNEVRTVIDAYAWSSEILTTKELARVGRSGLIYAIERFGRFATIAKRVETAVTVADEVASGHHKHFI